MKPSEAISRLEAHFPRMLGEGEARRIATRDWADAMGHMDATMRGRGVEHLIRNWSSSENFGSPKLADFLKAAERYRAKKPVERPKDTEGLLDRVMRSAGGRKALEGGYAASLAKWVRDHERAPDGNVLAKLADDHERCAVRLRQYEAGNLPDPFGITAKFARSVAEREAALRAQYMEDAE